MLELDHNKDWAPKNWCFQIVVLEKTLDTPLGCKEINPEYSLEGLMLKLRLQYFGHLMRRVDPLEKTLMLQKTEGRRRNGWQRMRRLNGIMDSMDLSLNKLQETMTDGNLTWCSPRGHKESDATQWLSNNNSDRRNKTINSSTKELDSERNGKWR